MVNGEPRNRIARLNPDGGLDLAFNPDTDGSVYSMALQTDGKILIGGDFTTVGGVARKNIARLHPNGTLDTGFDPNANSSVTSIVVQPDGRILAGGNFTTIAGESINRIARLNNTEAAFQDLTVSPNGSTITWMRGQASPEVWRVTFEHSTDSSTWIALGEGTRINGGWRLTGVSLPFNQNHYIRARGYAPVGYLNSCGSIFESIKMVYLIPALKQRTISTGMGRRILPSGGPGRGIGTFGALQTGP